MLDWKPPHAKWFVGGKINASVNCVDRHLRRTAHATRPRSSGKASPATAATLTYYDLHREVSQFANVLKSLGIKKGDRVALYLPLIPELAIAMLACARIGAVHSVVFGGFSAESLRDRINDAAGDGCSSPPTAVIGAARSCRSSRWPTRRSQDTPSIENVVVVQRGEPAHDARVHVQEGRDHWYHTLMAGGAAPLRARADGCRGSALHPLHLGHDREAEGDRPHDRRLPDRHLRDDEAGLRPEGRGRLLVHGRHRLGDRPQLRRLRSAGQRRHRR